MKRQFALLMTAVLLVVAMTACGRNDKNDANETAPQDPPAADNGTSQNGGMPDNSVSPGENNTGSDMMDDLEQAGDDLADGLEDAVEDVLPGDSADPPASRSRNAPNHQTTDNGRARDNGGVLTGSARTAPRA